MTPETHNIGEAATLPIAELHTYYRNPRRGDVDAIKASMQVNGIYKPIVVNRGTHTGRPNGSSPETTASWRCAS